MTLPMLITSLVFNQEKTLKVKRTKSIYTISIQIFNFSIIRVTPQLIYLVSKASTVIYALEKSGEDNIQTFEA